MIVGEVAIHVHIGGQRNYGDQIGWLQFGGDKFSCGIHGTNDFFRLHGREVEEQYNQTSVASVEGRRSLLGGMQERSSRGAGDGLSGRAVYRSTFSKSKVEIWRFVPSSSHGEVLASQIAAKFPFLSRTTTFTRTSSVHTELEVAQQRAPARTDSGLATVVRRKQPHHYQLDELFFVRTIFKSD